MKKYLIAFALIGLTMTSCFEKLNVSPPNSITTQQVMALLETADEETVITILGAVAATLPSQYKGGAYATFNNNFEYNYQGQSCLRNMTGNDLVYGSTAPSGDAGNYYSGISINTANSENTEAWWTRTFTVNTAALKVATVVTDELIAANPIDAMKKYAGWMYTTRAYAYLFGMEAYGKESSNLGLPIYTTSDVGQDLQARASYDATYDSILRWANEGVTLLASAGVGYDIDQTGISEGVANFILARAALLAGEYSTVITACDKLIANYSLMNQDQYVAVNKADEYPDCGNAYVYFAAASGFSNLEQNPEAILAWTSANKAYSSHTAWMNPFYGSYLSRMDDRLYDLMDDNDYRKMNVLVSVNDNPTTYIAGASSFIDGGSLGLASYATTKFAANVGNGSEVGATDVAWQLGTDFVEYRVSEAYLMKAEAQYMNGQESSAKETLDILLAARTVEGETALTFDTYKNNSGMSTLEMIQLQTRIEMWGERGLEWYNNLRWGIDVNRTGSTIHHNPAMTYSVANMVLKIPDSELNTNSLIVQN